MEHLKVRIGPGSVFAAMGIYSECGQFKKDQQ